jgi:hypothetical protein
MKEISSALFIFYKKSVFLKKSQDVDTTWDSGRPIDTYFCGKISLRNGEKGGNNEFHRRLSKRALCDTADM